MNNTETSTTVQERESQQAITLQLLQSTTAIVSAFCETNPIPAQRIPEVVANVGEGLRALIDPAAAEPEKPQPAVNPKKSVRPDAIISLIDGQPYKMLKRHITLHGYTPDSYRAAFDLPSDYPMVCPNYSDTRRKLAKEIGLGRNGGGRKAGA